MARFKHVLLAAALAPLAILSAVACDDEAGSENSASQESIDTVTERVQRNEMMYATLTLGTLALHDIDESLAAGTIESSFAPNARTAVRLYALTDWDDSLAADAQALHDHAVALLRALEDEDVDDAADAAHELHEGQHDFGDAVWAIVAADLPPDAGGVEEHADETPEAEGTAAVGETPATGATEDAGDDHDEAETPEAAATP